MKCNYTLYDEYGNAKEYSYKELIDLYQNSDYKDFSDIVYSKGTKQDSIYSRVIEKKKDYGVRINNNKLDGAPDYAPNEKIFTPQTLIDSGYFRLKGERVILEQDDVDFVNNTVESLKAEGMSEEEALATAKKTLSKWKDIINPDAKELHYLLNTFDFTSNKKGRSDFIDHLKGSKFEEVAFDLWDQLKENQDSLFRIMYGRHKLNGKAKIIQSVNLLAKLNFGEDIVGHIDNLVIDPQGTLHIYNYKLTTTPTSEWNAVKIEKYRYQLALLKRILAYNGFNVKNMELHIIPIRVHYNEDFSEIQNITVNSNYQDVPKGKAFIKYQTIANHLIKSNVILEPIKSDIISKINSNLNFFFKERDVKYNGIQQSVDEWINFNYSDKWENRIKKVNEQDHVYEIYFNDEFENPILIKDPTKPIENSEIREAVSKFLNESSSDDNEYLATVIKDLINSKRLGKMNLNKRKTNNRNLQIARSFIERNLSKYITTYEEKEVGGVKIKDFEWDLISNDTLLDANILLFKNKQDEIDVICLSNFNIRAKTKFNGQENIMGSWIKDANKDTRGLINFPASFANIEALRTMIVLNEILPELSSKELILGQLKIISTQGTGQAELYDFESLNKDLFQESIRVIKNNSADFNINNNFINAKYTDPIKLLLREYTGIIQSSDISAAEKEEISDLGFVNLESLDSRETKRIQIRAIIEKLFKLEPALESMSPNAIIDCSKNDTNPQRRSLANLYILCQDAYCYYSGIKVANEYRISKIREWGFRQDSIKNSTYQEVTRSFTKTIDEVSAMVKERYNPIYNFTEEYYNSKGFGHFRASSVGDQAKAFNNLYRRNDQGKIIMQFRNPYKQDDLPPMDEHERKYLKKVLFQLGKIRSEMYGITFNFNENRLEDPNYIAFIEKNKKWYFNVPLEKASVATVRSRGFKSMIDDWSVKAKKYIKNPKEFFDLMVQKMNSFESSDDRVKQLDVLSLQNPYIMTDGVSESSRRGEWILNSPEGFFETNVENILANYLEKHIQVKEFNKHLIAVKGILLQLEMLGDMVGEEHKAGLIQTVNMITDHTKLNVFNVSIMEPESQKIMTWLHPFRSAVSKAYIAGNIISMFRDTFEGMWQNTARMLTKYQTDIDAKSLYSAYKDVLKASFTSVRGITIIDELCKTYRLSNLDIARISEGLTTSKGGLLNIENWMYSTLRAPDFLNRMVLFIAKCKKDGCWEAFDLQDNKLVYDWRKDKRYSIYADESKKGTKEYEEQRIAYYNAIRQYNEDHPEHTISFQDDLPVAYSNQQIQQMRQLSNSVYGAYDKSMKAKYEHSALGITFGMFSTWMNGMISNYFLQPGIYEGRLIDTVQDTDGSGNLLFLDKDGYLVTEIINGDKKTYVYTETGNLVENLEGMVPVMKDVPLVVQGIFYTLKDCINAFKEGGFKQIREEIWLNPMQRQNILKLLTDLLASALFVCLFKFAITPLYKEFKKDMENHSIIENGLIEIMYKSSSRSYEGFFGPLTTVTYLGENTNPPPYKFTTKVGGDILKLAFGDKTVGEFFTGNIAIFKSFKDTYNAEVKKSQQ